MADQLSCLAAGGVRWPVLRVLMEKAANRVNRGKVNSNFGPIKKRNGTCCGMNKESAGPVD